MGRLIDSEDVYAVLTEYYGHKTDIQHMALKEALSKVETAPAIPIDWINQRIETLAETGGLLANLGAALVMKMVEEWKQEQNG